MSLQSQIHGFTFENSIRENVFNLPSESNNTDIHDIPKNKNIFNINENCSIKTTGSHTICCGDIIRFYNYNFDEQNTIIVVKYEQTQYEKIVKNIYEIDYNKECHMHLFGDLPKHILEEYVSEVKKIPKKIKGDKALDIYNYKYEKKKILDKYNFNIAINPKVDSSQSRVQCSIPNFTEKLKKFIKYKSSKESPFTVRGKKIVFKINSCRRKRNKKK